MLTAGLPALPMTMNFWTNRSAGKLTESKPSTYETIVQIPKKSAQKAQDIGLQSTAPTGGVSSSCGNSDSRPFNAVRHGGMLEYQDVSVSVTQPAL
jgi:hypothetical protein